MAEKNVKEEALDMFRDWSLEDMKEVCAEISQYSIELGAELDGLAKYINGLLSKITETLFPYFVSHIALKRVLVKSGIVSMEELAMEISECPELGILSRHLEIDLLNVTGKKGRSTGEAIDWTAQAMGSKVRKPN